MRSTTTFTAPSAYSCTASPSSDRSSKNSWYRRPEQPPGCTATRRARSSRPSWASSVLTLSAAGSVSTTPVAVVSPAVVSVVSAVIGASPGVSRSSHGATAGLPGAFPVCHRSAGPLPGDALGERGELLRRPLHRLLDAYGVRDGARRLHARRGRLASTDRDLAGQHQARNGLGRCGLSHTGD